jgi:hypothetical protein
MNARQLHHVWTRVRGFYPRPWYFFVAAGVTLIIAGFALRANNLHMVQLRDAVYTADKNNGDVSGALTNLQRYVTSHMNTKLASGPNAVYPPIQLKYTYDRLRAANAQSGNTQVYSDAQAQCEKQNPNDFSGRNRIPCIESYVESHGVQLKPIPDALYKFDFISPSWSPDLAGFSLLAALVLVVAGAGFWSVERWFKSRIS